MEIAIFGVGAFVILVVLLRRNRTGGNGPDEYVTGSEARIPGDDEANLRAGHWPGPGGPIKGSGGGNVSGGG